MSEYEYSFKVMMLGDVSVGKTSLTLRYISGFFLDDQKLTIGVDFYSKSVDYNDKKVKLQIWDFGGEERFRFLLAQYCKGANGALYLYDITRAETLDHLPDWLQIIWEHSGDIPILLIGSKLDLNEMRAVKEDKGILAAKKYNLSSFLELSSKTGENVEKTFVTITKYLIQKSISKTK